MANRNFSNVQSLEREIKKVYARIKYVPVSATATLATTVPVVLTNVLANSLYNSRTTALQVLGAAANPTDTVLAVWSGSAAATVITVTPNSGANNPATQATGTLNLTDDIVLTKTVAAKPGVAGNGCTLTTEVLAAAANPTNTILAAVTGTAAAIIITITPNDGTNNAATPVDLTTAELAELITSGSVVGKTVTVTDAGGLLNDQTATGGGAAVLVNAGEGDSVTASFVGGVNTAVSITTAELAELITTGAVSGKTVTVTDGSSLRALVTATGGGSQLLADAGEGDGKVATMSGGTDYTLVNRVGIQSAALTAAGTTRVSFQDRYVALKFVAPILIDSTARNYDVQVKAYDVNPASGYGYVDLYTLVNGSATNLPANTEMEIEFTLKNTSAPN